MSALEGAEGQFAVIKNWSGFEVATVTKVTAKQVEATVRGYKRTLRRDEVLAFLPDSKSAAHLAQALDGAQGECNRRNHAAHAIYSQARQKALVAFCDVRDKLIAKALGK